jgi:hypothetical protein
MGSGDIAGMFVSAIFLVSFAAVLILRGPLGKAWARRIEGTSAHLDGKVLPEVDQLQTRVTDLEQQVDRLHELEERLDFAERLLAQSREAAQLPNPETRR